MEKKKLIPWTLEISKATVLIQELISVFLFIKKMVFSLSTLVFGREDSIQSVSLVRTHGMSNTTYKLWVLLSNQINSDTHFHS